MLLKALKIKWAWNLHGSLTSYLVCYTLFGVIADLSGFYGDN